MKNEPAFPCVERRNTSSDPLATPREIHHPGMTLRDYFAGQALSVLRAGDAFAKLPNSEKAEKAATVAYAIADAMLAEREKFSDRA